MNALKITSYIRVFLLLLVNFAAYAATPTTNLESELLNACKAGNQRAVQKLIETFGVDVDKGGVNVNKGDEYGCTPVIIASQQRDRQILEILLNLKKSDGSFAVNVNQSNVDGITPLLVACKKRDYQTVEKLLELPGIDVNQADNNDETPLLLACKNNSCNLNLDIIDALLKKGAINKANTKVETPLEVTKNTIIHGYLQAYLIGEVGASKEYNALSPEECKKMKERDLGGSKAKEGIAFHE